MLRKSERVSFTFLGDFASHRVRKCSNSFLYLYMREEKFRIFLVKFAIYKIDVIIEKLRINHFYEAQAINQEFHYIGAVVSPPLP